MWNDVLIGLAIAAVTGGTGWVGMKLRKHWALPEKVDQLQDDVTYLRNRIDNVYDALINR